MTTEEEFERTEARAVVSSFDERFREQYGEGHLLMACHAAFPIAVTPDMLYQIWANFRAYSDSPTRPNDKFIDRLAVSDVLLWHCWQEVDPDVYELNTDVRACLLDILRQDSRFGEARLQELAQFLYQYTERIIQDQQGSVFREAQRWTAMATLAPAEATAVLANKLKEAADGSVGPDGQKVPNEPEVMRLRNVLEALSGQQEQFKGMLYVSKALKAHYLGYDADIIGEQIEMAKQQRGYGLTMDIKSGEPFLSIPIPVDISLPDKLELPEKPDSSVFILAVGIDDYEGMPLHGCVNDAHLLMDTLSAYSPCPVAYKGLLLNEQATKENVLNELRKILGQAGPEDIVVFTFSGHGQNARQRTSQNTIATYSEKSQILFGDPDEIAFNTITESEFRKLVREVEINDPHVLLITDTHNGSPKWLSLTNSKHIIITAGSDWDTVVETIYEGRPHGALTAALVTALRSNRNQASQTYHSLIRKICQTMQQESRSQTPQLFGTADALKRPFLSTKDHRYVYAWEMRDYLVDKLALSKNSNSNASRDLNSLLLATQNRYSGRKGTYFVRKELDEKQEKSNKETIEKLEQAMTTQNVTEGFSAVCIGRDEGLDQMETQFSQFDDLFILKQTENSAFLSFKSR